MIYTIRSVRASLAEGRHYVYSIQHEFFLNINETIRTIELI